MEVYFLLRYFTRDCLLTKLSSHYQLTVLFVKRFLENTTYTAIIICNLTCRHFLHKLVNKNSIFKLNVHINIVNNKISTHFPLSYRQILTS